MKMETVSLETHILEAADLIDSAVEQFLTEMGALLSADAAAMSPVDEGQLKGSWDYVVDTAEHSVTVGSNLENAVWNEFGTVPMQRTVTAERPLGTSLLLDTPGQGNRHIKGRSRLYTEKTECNITRRTVRQRNTRCSTQQIKTCRKQNSVWLQL